MSDSDIVKSQLREETSLPDIKDQATNNEDNSALCPSKPIRLNKTQKKLLRYQKLREKYKIKKANTKEDKKIKKSLENVLNNDLIKEIKENNTEELQESREKPNNYDAYLNKRELKRRANERLLNVYKDNSNSLKICIDCSFNNKMSEKEQSKLAQQIGRCYATNKAIEKPVHLTLCNLNKDSKFYSELVRLHDGFEKYSISTTEQPIDVYYSNALDSICYLSPDSSNSIEDLCAQNIYVIGGISSFKFFKKIYLF